MKFTIHRGTREIGGTCIEVCGGRSRVVLDLGMPLFTPSREPFDSRGIRGLTAQDLLKEGLLPRIPGLTVDGEAPEGIILSHAHVDHGGLIHVSNPRVPVYVTKGTSKMLLAETRYAGQPEVHRDRLRSLPTGRRIDLGNLWVTAYPVDHSIFDSVALLLEADGKRLLYTGDFRLHGRKPGMARRLIEAIQGSPLDVLLVEGTHVGGGREPGPTEEEVGEAIARHLQESPGLALAAFSPLNVDRLASFIKAANRARRTFVVDRYTSFVMHMVSSQCRIPRVNLRSGIRVLPHGPSRCRKVEALTREAEIGAAEILQDPGKFLLVFREGMLDEVFGGSLPAGTTLIYSYWKGYLDQLSGRRFKERLEGAGARLIPVHASGHAHTEDLARFIRAAGPREVVPVHTFHGEGFREFSDRVTLLEDGQWHEVS